MRRTMILMACLAATACAPSPASGVPANASPGTTPSRSAPSVIAPSVIAPSVTAPSGTPASPGGATPSTVRSDREAQGGCGDTPVQSQRPPAWATENAPGSPFVLGKEGNVVGYLFVDPLRAGRPTNPSNKILWYVRLPRDGRELRVAAHPRGAEKPVAHATFLADSGPGEIYPSATDVPEPGCWTFELTWGAHHDTVDLLYRR